MTKISNKDIATSIYQALRGKTGAAYRGTLESVVRVLSRRRLLPRARQILDELQKVIDRERGAVRARVLAARPLGLQPKRSLKKFLMKRYKAKEVIWEEAFSPELLGGARLQVNDEVLDLTLKNKIRKLREHLTA